MMTAKDREHAIGLAHATTDLGGLPTTQTLLARGLLAEHGEVLAGRVKIGDMAREAQASAERYVEQERRHVADLADARGVTARLRAALAEGSTDAAQSWAVDEAADIIATGPRVDARTSRLAAALLALHEERKATAERLAAVLAGVERVIAEARGA